MKDVTPRRVEIEPRLTVRNDYVAVKGRDSVIEIFVGTGSTVN